MNLVESVNILGDIITGTKSTNNRKRSNDCDNSNIYNSSNVKKGYKIMNERALERNNKSRDPLKTGIVNRNIRRPGSNKKSILKKEHFGNVNYQSDSEFSDSNSELSANSVISISNDPNLLVNQSQKLLDNRFHERQFQNKNYNDSFLNQYEPMKYDMKHSPSSSNAVQRSDSGVSRLQTERELAMKGGYSNFGDSKDLTYGIVSEDNFIHNNMIPQFKSATYGSDVMFNKNRNSISQRKMETFTGLLPGKIPKTEQKPLFSPLLGITNIYGTPSITNLIEDRYAPGRERKNELPFKQERITPGLNLGYNEVNKNGDNFRALPKTIDELRTLDNQQKTYTTPVVDGMKGSRGPVIGDVKKYKPERTKYWGNDRLLPSLGYIRAPAIYGEYNKKNLATVNRGMTDKTQIGPAKSEVQQEMPDNQREKYKVNFKQNFKSDGPRNVMLVEGLQAREDSGKYIADPTQRGKNQEYIGPIGTSQVTKGKAFDMITNIFDLTKRNLTENTDRSGKAIGTSEQFKSIAVDYNDIMDPTLRNIHSQYDRNGKAIGTSEQFKSIAVDYNDIMDPTLRNIHSQYDRNGKAVGTSEQFKSIAVDYNDIMDPTLRNIHSQYDRNGKAVGTSEQVKNRAIDYNDIMDPTLRNIHSQYDRNGKAVGTSEQFKNRAVDYKDVMDPTMRDIHSQYDRNGKAIGTSEQFKNRAIDYKDVMDPTMRDIHSKTDRNGKAIGTSEQSKLMAVDYKDVMDPTMRDIHSKTDRAGFLRGDRTGTYSINYTDYTPDITLREINSKTDRSGVITGKLEKSYNINYINYTPDQTMREIHSKTDRAGVVTGDRNSNYTINYINYTPDPTMRDIHSKVDRSAAGASGVYLATRTRDDANNSIINIQREVISKGRAPTNSKYNKGPTMDFTTVTLCEPIQIKRDLMSSTIAINEKLPFILTQTPTGRVVSNTRTNEFTQKVLNENPYINNIIHKSVEY